MGNTARNVSITENNDGPKDKYDPGTHKRYQVAETAGKGGIRGELWIPVGTTVAASDTFTLTVV